MLKNIFYGSLIVAIIDIFVYLYFSSSSYQSNHIMLAGFVQILFAEGLMALLVIWWVIYFVITKDFSNIWWSLIILLVITGYFANKQLQFNIKNSKQQSDKLSWLAKAENKEYVSDKLGISFKYISESEFGGMVNVQEKGDVIEVSTETGQYNGGALKVFTKNSKTELLDFLQKKYAKEYPSCNFLIDTRNRQTDILNNPVPVGYQMNKSGFPDNYVIIEMAGTLENDCPKIGIEAEHMTAIQNYFVMDSNKPDKYIFLSLSDYPVEAYVPKTTQDFPPKWFETITFK